VLIHELAPMTVTLEDLFSLTEGEETAVEAPHDEPAEVAG